MVTLASSLVAEPRVSTAQVTGTCPLCGFRLVRGQKIRRLREPVRMPTLVQDCRAAGVPVPALGGNPTRGLLSGDYSAFRAVKNSPLRYAHRRCVRRADDWAALGLSLAEQSAAHNPQLPEEDRPCVPTPS